MTFEKKRPVFLQAFVPIAILIFLLTAQVLVPGVDAIK